MAVRSIVLLPYSPWPANTGTKIEMMKHLRVLKEIGPCTIASARSKPVGFGWCDEAISALRQEGYDLVFREDSCRFNARQALGILYAAICKGLNLDKAFGHLNPYHRYAFSEKWWFDLTKRFDLAVMQYGIWARFKSACPQVVVLQEMLSNYHWGGWRKEVDELKTADLVLTVGWDEERLLRSRGIDRVLWSPPLVEGQHLPLTPDIGMIGTIAPQNVEGLRWLESGTPPSDIKIRVYGNIASQVKAPFLLPIGKYLDRYEPYQQCGIHLMTRGDRPGLQIKVVEALACGRAIVARRGSMRGVPHEKGAWIDVNSPAEMLRASEYLQQNTQERERMAAAAKGFYKKYLSSDKIIKDLREAYLSILWCSESSAP